jgi:serine/threonine protein kinase
LVSEKREILFFLKKDRALIVVNSSSKDQLTGMNVAIKKIMKPFSAPVLAKRTYRELKLLKALMHENVSK